MFLERLNKFHLVTIQRLCEQDYGTYTEFVQHVSENNFNQSIPTQDIQCDSVYGILS